MKLRTIRELRTAKSKHQPSSHGVFTRAFLTQGVDHAGLQPVDRSSTRNLRLHPRQDRVARLRPDRTGDRTQLRHQIAERGYVPSKGAREKGIDSSRRLLGA